MITSISGSPVLNQGNACRTCREKFKIGKAERIQPFTPMKTQAPDLPHPYDLRLKMMAGFG